MIEFPRRQRPAHKPCYVRSDRGFSDTAVFPSGNTAVALRHRQLFLLLLMSGITLLSRTPVSADEQESATATAANTTIANTTEGVSGEKNPEVVTNGSGSRSVPPDHVERVRKGTALFRSSVRKILIDNCLDCHGGKSTKADFSLASFENLRDSGFLGENSESSHLMSVITHAAEPHMPLNADRLPDDAIAHIRSWIDLGAPYDAPLSESAGIPKSEMQVTDADREFWAFRRLSEPEIPAVRDTGWCRTPIDHFIRARQEAAGLDANPEADRRVLIRRAAFALLGLPPAPHEVEEFLADESPDAWSDLIDRLLESPHYGERWARHWMDVARFAESHGYEQDYDRPNAFHYRDFLIQAFNNDLPYDRFVQWQLAGDELEPGNPLAMMATGFLGAGAFPTQLTEAEFESARYDELDDMVMTTGVAFLGLSVGCARCHDHKFDPIPARDYYRLVATFGTAVRAEAGVDLKPEDTARRVKMHEQHQSDIEREAEVYRRKVLPLRFDPWLEVVDLSDYDNNWEKLKVLSTDSTAGTEFQPQPDGSLLATGTAPASETITVVADSFSETAFSLRLEVLKHQSLPHHGPGRADNGNFALCDLRVQVAQLAADGSVIPETEQKMTLKNPRATHEQNAGSLSVAAAIDNDAVSGWAVDDGGISEHQAAVFDLAAPYHAEHGVRWTITMAMTHPNPKHTLGCFRLSVADRPDHPAELEKFGPDGKVMQALKLLKSSPGGDTEEQQNARNVALEWFAAVDPTMVDLDRKVAMGILNRPQPELTKVMVTSEGLPHLSHHADDRGFPHFYPQTYFLKRGDVHQKQDVVSPGLLQVLSPSGADISRWQMTPPEGWSRTSFRRATLSQWMTDVDHGAGSLAARVIVNRLWQHHFGRGIVATPNDFGISGERPVHPELLEWLARDLVQHGWQLKRLHKLIMMSRVWMQSSAHDEQRAMLDRENVLLWRRSPRRLEAEAIRDAMLSVSGMLDSTMFGPGTLNQNSRRRSIYFFIKRSQLIPTMMLFDWPEHLVSIGQRPVTTVAPQALMFMNSPQGRMYAAALADQLSDSGPQHAVKDAWLLAFGRTPTDAEFAAGMSFLDRQAKVYQSAGNEQPDHSALVDLCQMVLSLNEFIYVD